ncbi:phosphatase PAP2 family protein [Chitinibacter bivalviorum]|uniref:Phosphatase PAP2 family protein n=1 Tax=Chitinibacter bivalviorum TaxID=2739434 RepID=A0A7H9BLS6_9NEIS|nr:phosphatase PAP2 family protein [Chitinibacter bivalviorum]QLG89627.1 phosphatase PAP2 family protein [Chitinibacter bivalviorum]
MKHLRQLTLTFWLLHLGIPLLFAAVMLWFYPQTNWDIALISPYFDGTTHSFYLKNNFLLDGVMHTGVKSVLFLGPILTIAALLWSIKNLALRPYRRRLFWLLAGQFFGALVVSLLKKISIHACPWDLKMFGGYAPFLPLFADLPAGMNPGRCFPGGHASGGFSLLAFYFALRDDYQRWANWALVIGLLLGSAMGWAQMMRGAHFLSHNLWTMWWVWMSLLLLYLVWPPVKDRPVIVAQKD